MAKRRRKRTVKAPKPKRNIHEVASSIILESLQAGADLWHSPYPPGEPPLNYATDKPILGLRAIYLNAASGYYHSRYWISKTEIKQRGSIRKGQSGVWFPWWAANHQIRSGHYWNIEQVDLPLEIQGPDDIPPNPVETYDAISNCQSLIESLSCRPRIVAGDSHRYDPDSNLVMVPHPGTEDPENWYSLLFRNLTESAAGAASLPGRAWMETDKLAELSAQIATGYLCAEAGIRNHSAPPHYEDWKQFLETYSTAFLTACQNAVRIIRYLKGEQSVKRAVQAA